MLFKVISKVSDRGNISEDGHFMKQKCFEDRTWACWMYTNISYMHFLSNTQTLYFSEQKINTNLHKQKLIQFFEREQNQEEFFRISLINLFWDLYLKKSCGMILMDASVFTSRGTGISIKNGGSKFIFGDFIVPDKVIL